MDLFIIQHIHLSIYLSISLSIYLVVIYKILQVVMNQHVFFPLSSNNMLHKVDFIKKLWVVLVMIYKSLNLGWNDFDDFFYLSSTHWAVSLFSPKFFSAGITTYLTLTIILKKNIFCVRKIYLLRSPGDLSCHVRSWRSWSCDSTVDTS